MSMVLSFSVDQCRKAISPIVQSVFLVTYSDLQMEELEAICARLKVRCLTRFLF